MPSYWAPRGGVNNITNAFDRCNGMNEINAIRKPQQEWFTNVNAVLYYISLAFWVSIVLLWVLLRNEKRMKTRGLVVALLSFVAVFLANIQVLYRRSMLLEANGQSNMNCLVFLFVALIPCSTQGAVGALRLMNLLNSARYARGARLFKVTDSFSDLEISALNGKQYVVETKPTLTQKQRIIRFVFGEVRLLLVRIKSLIVTFLSAKAIQSYTETELLAVSKNAITPASSVLFAFVWVFLSVVPASLILIFTLDPYFGNCVGCDLFVELLIAQLVVYCLGLLPRFRLAALLREEPDPDEIRKEMKIGLLLVMPFWISFVVLVLVDPEQYDWNQYLTYEWLYCFSVNLYAFYSIVIPLWVTIRQKYKVFFHALDQREERRISRGVMRELIYTNAKLYTALQDFAQKRLSSELISFVSCVKEWHLSYSKNTKLWRILKLHKICETYFEAGAPLELNLMDSLRCDVLNKAREHFLSQRDVPIDFFDEVEWEVFSLIRVNLWSDFMEEKEVKKIMARIKRADSGTSSNNNKSHFATNKKQSSSFDTVDKISTRTPEGSDLSDNETITSAKSRPWFTGARIPPRLNEENNTSGDLSHYSFGEFNRKTGDLKTDELL